MAILFKGIQIFLDLLSWIILADVILSWIAPGSSFKEFTSTVTEPLLAPFRGLSEKITKGRLPIDFSPTIALLVIYIASGLIGLLY